MRGEDDLKAERLLRQKLEEELKDSRRDQERYRTIAENSTDAIARIAPDRSIVYANKSFSSLWGQAPANLAGRKIAELQLPAEAVLFLEKQIATVFRIGQLRITQLQSLRAGLPVHLDWRFIPEFAEDRNVKTVLCVARDMTPLIQANEALRDSAARFRMIFETAPIGIILCDTECRTLQANPASCRMLGYSSAELIGMDYRDINFPEGLPEAEARFAQYLEGRHEFPPYEKRYRRKDGSAFWAQVTPVIIPDRNGKPFWLLALFDDISERRSTQLQLANLATITEQAEESIMIVDPDGVISYVNQAFERIAGYGRAEVVGRPAQMLLADDLDPAIEKILSTAFIEGRIWRGRLAKKNRSGKRFEVEAKFLPIRDDAGRIISYVAVESDISKEIELERKLIQAQKMESIGTLAGGIAHDFNNILAPIIGYTEICMASLPGDSPLLRNLAQVLKAAERAKEMIRHILTFSRQTEQKLKPIRIQPIVKESLKLLRASLPATIEIRQDIDDGVGPVLSDPTQINQIIMNLCTNAYHAMPAGGTLDVSVGEVRITPQDATPQLDLKAGGYVRLCVKDTGTGIPPEIIERIFDPYFTTKTPDRGTGLGLSVVHGIVTNSGGHIGVHSEPGQGTAFTIHLPRIDGCQDQVKDQPSQAVPHGSETILLVDDDYMLREMMQEMLEYLGYRVFAAKHGQEAAELFRKEPDRFDLVITDMTMPHMTGTELAATILSIRPAMPIILSTGYSDVMSEEQARKLGIQAFVMKPVIMEQMAGAIRRVLAEASQ